MKKKKKIKAIVLLSGGLDSGLAAKIIQKQNIDLTAVSFKSYFFNSQAAQEQAEKLNIPIKIINISKDQFSLVKKPKHGYGAAMNPCLDCHCLMLKKAKQMMTKEKDDFLVTGDVLNQRPFSQSRCALKLIDKEAGTEGLVLRPLSARLLEPTVAEKEGWVNRKSMYQISGKSRREQIKLSKEFKLKKYLTPAGGCLLTDPIFSQRLKDLLSHSADPGSAVMELLKVGRHFWQKGGLIVVGRNNEENDVIKNLAEKGDILVALIDVPGPTVLVKGRGKKLVEKAKELTRRYANKAREVKQIKYKIVYC